MKIIAPKLILNATLLVTKMTIILPTPLLHRYRMSLRLSLVQVLGDEPSTDDTDKQ